eukprot:gene7905-10730_t
MIESNQSPSKNTDSDIESKCCYKYVQFFKENDDGVPPFCRHKICPLDHRNYYFNNNKFVDKLGYFGFDYFDQHRKFFLGFASVYTIFAMFITVWGCMALTTTGSVVELTYWEGGTGTNNTFDSFTNQTVSVPFTVYVGLRSLEFVNCPYVSPLQKFSSSCQQISVQYTDAQCANQVASGAQALTASACGACGSVATSMWATAFFSCLGLSLSLFGAQTRMRIFGDVPAQKLLGMCGEFWGTLSLGVALYIFHMQCLHNLHLAFRVTHIKASFWAGPGLYCYAFCCISGAIRACLHILTPLPGRGSRNCNQLWYSFCKFSSTKEELEQENDSQKDVLPINSQPYSSTDSSNNNLLQRLSHSIRLSFPANSPTISNDNNHTHNRDNDGVMMSTTVSFSEEKQFTHDHNNAT